MEGFSATLLGVVADGNHSNTDLLVKWSSDTRELCSEQPPDFDGTTSCQAILEEGESQIKLQVIDPDGAVAISSINISVMPTLAPTITLLSPTIDENYYSDQLILFSAIIEDNEDASTEPN